jgi:hypothetical protein
MAHTPWTEGKLINRAGTTANKIVIPFMVLLLSFWQLDSRYKDGYGTLRHDYAFAGQGEPVQTLRLVGQLWKTAGLIPVLVV